MKLSHCANRRKGAAWLAPLTGVAPAELLDLPNLAAYLKVSGLPSCSIDLDPYGPCPPQRTKLRPGELRSAVDLTAEDDETEEAVRAE